MLKKSLLATMVAVVGMTTPAYSDDVKMGILLGFTGPAESLASNMALSAEMAWNEASVSGLLLNGTKIISVRGDSTCNDSSTAVTATERLVNSEGVLGIMGPTCSGVAVAVTRNVTANTGVTLVSPSATSPAITKLEDNDYTFRTVPSDARQGIILAELALENGINEIAVTYVNDDYGKGLSISFEAAFKERGGKVLLNAGHEDGRGDYSAEIGALSASGAEILAVFGRFDQGGKGLIQTALDTGAFEKFLLGDGMISQLLIDNIGSGLEGSLGTQPGSSSEAAKRFVQLAKEAGFDGDGGFRAESYDAAAVLALALQAAGSPDRAAIQQNIRKVSNAPGIKIFPGEIAKGLEILSLGGKIDYQGATGVEFDENGEVPGTFRIFEVKSNKFEVISVQR